ncbi:hypothetical protein D2V08_13690 [Flagellimonas lutimaris]|jgi:hypothetical protein|uniref:DUF3325 domain-containing protein n=1 Tax=Flagellimonas lutimaris TaxID=475082 RepID=A0A3A1N7U8_9FLAO|nr:hypothetical protein [Allomuricauda lutimaris]RIV31498.1 hypothetical protein D2V08_13690 [Allomuricauda lutimaris]|tara:strand:+ start:1171 stop:1503 length:333 start_codon:yes stop_codon:yes gene_type:complete
MVTGISLLTFIAFYLQYNTSKKMSAVGNLGFEKWIGAHKKTSQYASLALMVLSFGLSCFYWGIGSGTFTFFILLMTIASLVILLAPLRLLNYRFLGVPFLCSILFESLLF